MSRGKTKFCRCMNRFICDRRWMDRKCINMKKSFDEVYAILNPRCKCCKK